MNKKEIKKLDVPTAKWHSTEQAAIRDLRLKFQNYTALLIIVLVLVGLCASIVYFNVNFNVNIGRYPIAFLCAVLGISSVFQLSKVIRNK